MALLAPPLTAGKGGGFMGDGLVRAEAGEAGVAVWPRVTKLE